MSGSLLVTRPNFDLTTRYISAWAEKVIEFAKLKNKKVFDLAKSRANLKEFESVIRKQDPGLIFLNGHGNENQVTGQNNQVLLALGNNEDLLKNKSVYALSCRSGKSLGPGSIDKKILPFGGQGKY